MRACVVAANNWETLLHWVRVRVRAALLGLLSEFGFCCVLLFVVCVCVFVSYVSVDSFTAISATCQRQLGPLGQLGYGGGRGYASGGNASFRFEHNIFCQLKWCT